MTETLYLLSTSSNKYASIPHEVCACSYLFDS